MKKLLNRVIESLENSKANHIVTIHLPENHSLTAAMVIVDGTSSRHVYSIAARLIDDMKKQGSRPLGIEGLEDSEWILVDLNDVIVHVMQVETRDFYQLERLWQHIKVGGNEDEQDNFPHTQVI